MDSHLFQNTLKSLRAVGAEDAAILKTDTWTKFDAIVDGKHREREEKNQALELFVNVDGAIARADLLNDRRFILDEDALRSVAFNTFQAAKIARAWGVQYTAPSLTAYLGFSPAPAPEFDKSDNCPKYPHNGACSNGCFSKKCMSGRYFNPAAPYEYQISAIASKYPQLHLDMDFKTSCVRNSLHTFDDVSDAERFETAVGQTLTYENEHKRRIQMQKFLFDGVITDKNAPELEFFQSALDIAPRFMRSNLTTSTRRSAPRNICRIILSPWAAAVLAHEAMHLHAPIEQPGIIINRDASLFVPPERSTCRGFAIQFAGSAIPMYRKMFSSISERTFIVDAPARWIRRNHRLLDVYFDIAGIGSHRGYEQHFQSLILRFDLIDMWKNARIAAGPAKRISIPCSGGMTTVETPWIETGLLKVLDVP